MLVQRENEKRIEYLARVLHWIMNRTIAGEQMVDYDDTTCDGLCLAEDICAELNIDIYDDINS